MSDTDRDLADADDDLLAAEYSLGVLPAVQQSGLRRRVELDAGFQRRVLEWEERLAPIAEGFGPQEVPPTVKRALDLRLFGQAPVGRTGAGHGIWASLGLWRGVAAFATAAFLVAVIPPAMEQASQSGRLAASLTAEGSNVRYLVLYDAARARVSLAALTADPVEGRDFQLWIAEGDQAPVSLGVIPAGVATEVAVTEQIRALMSPASHMAISLEPRGGSPTGQPTGPILAVGDLLSL